MFAHIVFIFLICFICPSQFSMAAAAAAHFRTAVDAIFAHWPGLQLVLGNNSLGQPTSVVSAWMVNAMTQWFSENKDLEHYEVEEYLDELLDREFSCLVQDGSTGETAKMLCEFREFCYSSQNSDEQVLAKLATLPKCDLSRCQVQLGDDEVAAPLAAENGGGGDQEMEVDDGGDDGNGSSNSRAPQMDADGWTTIPAKARNKKR
jgi:hypothetical protein